MKTIKTIAALCFLGAITTLQAQQSSVKSETNIKAISYYQQRGAEDARFEMAFEAKTKDEQKAFWKEQKAYEKELKERNRKAYRAYIASKKEVYVEHYSHCDAHCHHDDYFYNHAGFYYYQYDRPNYQRTPGRTSVNTQIGVGVPAVRSSVRLGL